MTLVAIVFAALPLLPACPNLSGTYEIPGEDGAVTVTITQHACDRVEIEWLIDNYAGSSRTRHVLQTDGVFRPDPAWVAGRGAHVTSARFVDERLELVAKRTQSDTLFSGAGLSQHFPIGTSVRRLLIEAAVLGLPRKPHWRSVWIRRPMSLRGIAANGLRPG